MELLQLGRIDKGSVSMDGKYTSLSACLFGCKDKKKSLPSSERSEGRSGGSREETDKCYISRDTLVKFHAKRGKRESIEYYRVIGIFSKHYIKWFLDWDFDKVLYKHDSKKYKILARMVKLDGNHGYKEVDLVAGGQWNWNTKSVFALRVMADIVSVEGDLSGRSCTQW